MELFSNLSDRDAFGSSEHDGYFMFLTFMIRPRKCLSAYRLKKGLLGKNKAI